MTLDAVFCFFFVSPVLHSSFVESKTRQKHRKKNATHTRDNSFDKFSYRTCNIAKQWQVLNSFCLFCEVFEYNFFFVFLYFVFANFLLSQWSISNRSEIIGRRLSIIFLFYFRKNKDSFQESSPQRICVRILWNR